MRAGARARARTHSGGVTFTRYLVRLSGEQDRSLDIRCSEKNLCVNLCWQGTRKSYSPSWNQGPRSARDSLDWQRVKLKSLGRYQDLHLQIERNPTRFISWLEYDMLVHSFTHPEPAPWPHLFQVPGRGLCCLSVCLLPWHTLHPLLSPFVLLSSRTLESSQFLLFAHSKPTMVWLPTTSALLYPHQFSNSIG